MSFDTPRPSIDIPPSIFRNYENPNDIANIKVTNALTFHEIIGIGCHGIVYRGTLDPRIDGYDERNIIIENVDMGNIINPIQVAVKEMKGDIDTTTHKLMSKYQISPKIYQIIYSDICDDDNCKTYIVYELMDRMISYNDLQQQKYINQFAEKFTRMIELGYFHNDIRDTNIMVNTQGDLRIIDFESSVCIYTQNSRPRITISEYDNYMYHNYNIYINGKKYIIMLPLNYQKKLMEIRCKFCMCWD